MPSSALNERIVARGRALFAAVADEKPSLFSSATWTGRVMQWAMANEAFKTSLFRFVDVFPSLRTSAQVTAHIRQYFGDDGQLPPVLIHMTAVGEETGDLPRVLLRVAETLDGEAEIAMKRLTTLIEPMIVIFMGGFVGFVVLSILLPVFQANSIVQ